MRSRTYSLVLWVFAAHAGRVTLLHVLPGFLVAVVFIAASPGPAVALVLRRAAFGGARATVPVVLGLEAGLYAWALAAGAGLAAVVAASQTACTVLRVVGAAVLVWLGLRAWRAARATDDVAPDGALPAVRSSRPSLMSGFAEGLLVQLANPKAAVFMFAFYPQFLPHDGPVLAWTAGLGLIQTGIESVLYLLLAAAVGRTAGWFRRPTVRRRLDAASGTVLVGLGVRVALESR